MMVLKIYKYRMVLLFLGAAAIFIVTLSPAISHAMAGRVLVQESFSSPKEAAAALVTAVQSDNYDELLAILGAGSEDLFSTGDKVADRKDRERFIKAYEDKNSLNKEDDGRVVLIIGSKDYPFPIPIVRKGDAWLFDTRAGMEEILTRRIGRNELHTIEVMRTYTDAQREYACMKTDKGGPSFAQRFASSEGKKDGLYWEVGKDEEVSPFGQLIARATVEGYEESLNKEPPEPFHGYYFKILKRQGEHAGGGAFDYVVDGRMVLGFSLVAYPSRYGSSGIITFIINQEGVIYEKDFGKDTVMAAAALTAFDPDETWRRYKELADQ